MWSVRVIWLVFTLLFGALTYISWRQTKCKLERLESMQPYPNMRMVIMGVDFGEMLSRIQSFASAVEKSNREMGVVAMWGYAAAAVTSLVSLVLTFWQ